MIYILLCTMWIGNIEVVSVREFAFKDKEECFVAAAVLNSQTFNDPKIKQKAECTLKEKK